MWRWGSVALTDFDFWIKYTHAINVRRSIQEIIRDIECVVQKLLYGSVIPVMADQLNHVDSMELVLPAFLALIERSSADEYRQHIRPHFNRVFKATRSVQVWHLSYRCYHHRHHTIYLLWCCNDVILMPQFLKVVQLHILGVVGNVIYYIVRNLTDFPAVREFWKSVKILRNYHHNRVARFFEKQCKRVYSRVVGLRLGQSRLRFNIVYMLLVNRFLSQLWPN